jgi:uncharacterized membrane protein YgaE (UPF0421/DUF939 family)
MFETYGMLFAAVEKQLEDEHVGFDKEAWLAKREPYMRKRFEEMFKQQDAVDALLENLQKERHALEEKYMKLCGTLRIPPTPCPDRPLQSATL